MTKHNEPDLFTQAEEIKEEPMKAEKDNQVEKVNQMSRALKYKPGGTHHPDRINDNSNNNSN